jgi:putative membrane protein
MNYILKILITAVNAFLLAYLLPGIEIHNFGTALLVAFVLSLLNGFIKPILILLTLPVTVFTLGLFLLIINAVIILIDAHFVGGFEINDPEFLNALLFSILLSLTNSFAHSFTKKKEEKKGSEF